MTRLKMRRLKTITSYAGKARWMAETTDLGWTPRHDGIPNPYSYGPTDLVYLWDRGARGKARVVVKEVSHKRYEVWELDPSETVYASNERAEEVWIGRRAVAAPRFGKGGAE